MSFSNFNNDDFTQQIRSSRENKNLSALSRKKKTAKYSNSVVEENKVVVSFTLTPLDIEWLKDIRESLQLRSLVTTLQYIIEHVSSDTISKLEEYKAIYESKIAQDNYSILAPKNENNLRKTKTFYMYQNTKNDLVNIADLLTSSNSKALSFIIFMNYCELVNPEYLEELK